MNNRVSFLGKTFFGVVIVFVLVFGMIIVGCGGFKIKKEQPAEKPAAEQKGSLTGTFTVIDGQGRNAGTLTVDFSGGAVLKDADGKVIGTFKPAGSVEVQPSQAQSKPQPVEAQPELEKKEAQTKAETTEVQPEPEKADEKSEPYVSDTDSQKKE